MPRTIETTVYKFDELSEDAKQVAIDEYRDGVMYEDLEIFMNDELYNLFDKYKIEDMGTTVRYSLSYSQGDGASFTGDIEWRGYRATIETNQWGVYYQHNKSVHVTEMSSIKTDKDASSKMIEKLQAIVETIGQELEEFGYGEIEYADSDENIIEQLSDCEFKEDGTTV